MLPVGIKYSLRGLTFFTSSITVRPSLLWEN